VYELTGVGSMRGDRNLAGGGGARLSPKGGGARQGGGRRGRG
jgi:hypothetical protein